MSISVFGAPAIVTTLNRAFNNTSPANAVFNNQVSQAGTTEASYAQFALSFGQAFSSLTDDALATRVLGNLGLLPNDGLVAALKDYFVAVGPAARGVVVLQLGQLLSSLENATGEQAVFAPKALAWNQEIEQSFTYSSNVGNTSPFTGDFAPSSGAVLLSRFTDVREGAIFNGFLDYNQFTGNDEQTLTSADRLTGTTDNDVLFAQLNGAGTRPSLTSIETVAIDAKANAVGLDLSDATGVKKVVNKGSNESATLTFSNLNSLVDVEIENTNSNTTLTFAPSVVAGNADVLKLSVKGAGIAADRANVTVNENIESLEVTASGTASLLGNVTTNNTLKTITIKGDQNLSVGTKANGAGFTSTAVTTVDGSEATGKLFVNVSASGAQNQTITTGAGDDTIVVSGLTALDTITSGEGSDRVVVVDAGTNQAAKLVGVEQIEVRTAGTNLNLVNATSVNLIAIAEVAGAASIANVTAVKTGTTFAFEGEGIVPAYVNGDNVATFGDIRFNLASATGATDVINFTYGNKGTELGTNGTVNIGQLVNSGNNVETLNFTFSDVGADDTVIVANIDGTATAKLNVTSDSKVTLNNVNDLTKLTAVDATAVKGAFTAAFGAIGAAADASVLVGGTGNNNVTVTKAADSSATTNKVLTVDASAGSGSQTFNLTNNDNNTTAGNTSAGLVFVGGSGADAVSLTTVVDARSSVSGGAGIDNITLGGAGVNVLVLSLGDTGPSIATGDTVTGFNAAAKDLIDLRNFGFDVGLQAVTAAGAPLNGTAAEFGGRAAAVATSGGGATLYIDANGDNKLGEGDLVVNLVGVAAANITTADILWS